SPPTVRPSPAAVATRPSSYGIRPRCRRWSVCGTRILRSKCRQPEGKKTTSCSSRLLRMEEHSPVTASTEPGDCGRRLPGLRRPRVEPGTASHLLVLSIRECKQSAGSRNMVTMRTREWLIGLMLVFVSTGRAVGIASLQATSATVAAPGADADLCVVLDSHG